MLHDTVFHLVQAIVVGIKNALGAFQVKVVLGVFLPRQVNEVLQIVQLDAVFRRLRMRALQLLQFPIEDLCHFLRPFLLRRLLRQLLDILLVGSTAQFLLNGTQLLVKIILALLLVHIDAHLALYLLLQFHHLLLIGQHSQEVSCHLVEVARLQEPLSDGHIGLHIAGHEVQEEHRVIYVFDGKASLLRQVTRTGNDLNSQLPDRLNQSIEFLGIGNVYRCCIGHHCSFEIRLGLRCLNHLKTTFALDDNGDVAVGHLEGLENLGRGTHLIQVIK